MTKLNISRDEKYPFLDIEDVEDAGTGWVVEVPDDVAERWQAAMTAFRQCQLEMDAAWSKAYHSRGGDKADD